MNTRSHNVLKNRQEGVLVQHYFFANWWCRKRVSHVTVREVQTVFNFLELWCQPILRHIAYPTNFQHILLAENIWHRLLLDNIWHHHITIAYYLYRARIWSQFVESFITLWQQLQNMLATAWQPLQIMLATAWRQLATWHRDKTHS